MRVSPISINVNYNNGYQDNPHWAFHNKQKGFIATCFSAGSTASGLVKACSSKDSKVYKVSNFLEKFLYSASNCLQYLLFGRKDDVLGDDEEKRPLAAKVGKVATFQEKYINPFAKPALVLLDTNQQDSLNDALNFFDVFYWKIRFALEKIQWNKIKLIPANIQQLFDPKIQTQDKDKITKMIGEIIAPIFGWIGTVCIGIFTPIKAGLKFFNIESKVINCLTYIGKAAINIPYFFKFTLPMFWKGLITKDKKFHAAFAVGTASNILNIGLPVIELLPTDSQVAETFSKIYKSLAGNLAMLFFPLRRNSLGEDWINTHTKNPVNLKAPTRT